MPRRGGARAAAAAAKRRAAQLAEGGLGFGANETALYTAARQGNTHDVRLLQAAGVDLDAPNARGETPLYAAAVQGHDQTVRLLASLGAMLDAPDLLSATPFWAAARAGHVRLLHTMLELAPGARLHGRASAEGGAAVARLIDRPNRAGMSPLYIAAHEGRAKVVRCLLDLGALVDAPAHDGSTALCVAAHKGHTSTVEALIDAGAALDDADRPAHLQPEALARAAGNLITAEWIALAIDKRERAKPPPPMSARERAATARRRRRTLNRAAVAAGGPALARDALPALAAGAASSGEVVLGPLERLAQRRASSAAVVDELVDALGADGELAPLDVPGRYADQRALFRPP